MPTTQEYGGLIFTLDMGAKDAMENLGLISKKASKVQVVEVFTSLDLVLQQELKEEDVIVSTISHLCSFCLYLISILCHMHKHLLLFTHTRIQPRVGI